MWPALCLLAPVLLSGTPAAAQRVRDSAGIRIVESSQPALPTDRMWRVMPQAILQIGSVDGDSLYEFLRVSGMARLSDGRIAVANQGSSTVRFFDARGSYLGAFGRTGDGPGEFRQILGMRAIRGDSLAVADLNRANYYSGRGVYARALLFTAPERPYIYVSSFLPDGSYLGFARRIARPAEPRSGRWVDSATLYRVGPGAAELDSLGSFPRSISSSSPTGRGPQSLGFGPRLRLAASAAEVYVGFPEHYEIRVLSHSGELRRIIRRNAPRRPTPAAAIKEHREWLVDQPGEDGRPAPARLREQRARYAEELAFVSELPAYSTLLVDRTDHLWVKQYETWEEFYRPGPLSIQTHSHPSQWDVFNPSGAWIGRVELPGNFTPLEIGADYVAGLWRDADDVEFVRFYRLVKP